MQNSLYDPSFLSPTVRSPDEMATYITSVQCDGSLGDIMRQYKDNGVATAQGFLLIKLPKSRPAPVKPASNSAEPATIGFQGVTTIATKDDRCPGIYFLVFTSEVCGVQHWTQMHAESLQRNDVTEEQFMQFLNGGQPSKISFPDIDFEGNHTPMRRVLGIKTWPFSRVDTPMKFAGRRTTFREFQSTTISVLNGGTAIPAFTALGGLNVVCYLHQGSVIEWIIVPPRERMGFESKIQDYLCLRDAHLCALSLNHLHLWIHPQLLIDLAIPFQTVKQPAEQALFIFPGTYVWGFSPGYAVLERSYHSGGTLDRNSNAFCTMSSQLCGEVSGGAAPCKLTDADYDKIEQDVKDSVQKQPTGGRRGKGKTPGENSVSVNERSDLSPVRQQEQIDPALGASGSQTNHSHQQDPALHVSQPDQSPGDPHIVQEGPLVIDRTGFDEESSDDRDATNLRALPANLVFNRANFNILVHNNQELLTQRYALYQRKEAYKVRLDMCEDFVKWSTARLEVADKAVLYFKDEADNRESYVEGLEKQMADCDKYNMDLEEKLDRAETANNSLEGKLRTMEMKDQEYHRYLTASDPQTEADRQPNLWRVAAMKYHDRNDELKAKIEEQKKEIEFQKHEIVSLRESIKQDMMVMEVQADRLQRLNLELNNGQ